MSIRRLVVAVTALSMCMTPGLLAFETPPATAASWQVVPPPPDTANATLYGVTAVAANDVWAAGVDGSDEPLIEHWNGTGWAVSATPALPSNGWLFGISADAANDVWAVGQQTVPPDGEELTLAEHWNGSKWKVVPTPNPYSGSAADADLLTGVQALSPTDVWAVGYAESPTQRFHGLVERWNGSAWAIAPAPKGTPYSISMVSDGVGWVTGFFKGKRAARWNGSSWKGVDTPLVSESSLSAVLTESKASAWAVGVDEPSPDAEVPLIEQYGKGTGWTSVPTGSTSQGALYAVGGSAPDDLWAAGVDATQSTSSFLFHWNGAAWSQVAGPTVADEVQLESVTGVPGSQEAWAVGFSDDGQVTEHYA